MEEKLTFTRVPRSVYWLCNTNFQQSSKKSYTTIVDYFQKDAALKNLLQRALPTGEGRPSLEAQLSGYGIKGFRDRLGELYLAHLEQGFFPDEVEVDRALDVIDFEQRFERFSTMSDFRLFLLGMYLKMRDLENFSLFQKRTSYLSVPLEVDEILATSDSKVPRIDWMIVVLTSLLKFWPRERIMDFAQGGEETLTRQIRNLDDKSKMIFFNDMSAYGHGIDERDFFLYQKV